jgi:hypothetical protein
MIRRLALLLLLLAATASLATCGCGECGGDDALAPGTRTGPLGPDWDALVWDVDPWG